ncbi:MAG: alkaline phosphatase [Pirellulales bacterium]
MGRWITGRWITGRQAEILLASVILTCAGWCELFSATAGNSLAHGQELPQASQSPNKHVDKQVARRTTNRQLPGYGKQQADTATLPGSVRNVILMIGDGMGPQQLGLLEMYAHRAPNSVVPERTPAIEKMMAEGTLGLVRTEPYGVLVTDSAAAATQFATGQPARSEMIGTNFQGDTVSNLVEVARQQGKSTGLVTDTRITHATPAGFAAHQPHRTMENEVAIDYLNNQVDVLLGGGLRNWVPKAANNSSSAAAMGIRQLIGNRFSMSSKRKDNRNLLLEARARYQLAFDRQMLAQVSKGPLLGLFADSEMQDALTEHGLGDGDQRTQPSLVEMAAKALELLAQNEQGFFLMIEGGQIDWAGHNNDVGNLLHELLQFDEVVRYVDHWASQRDDTLLVVTADHETGSFGFSYSGSPLPRPQPLSGDVFQQQDYSPYFNFAPLEILDKIYAQKKSYFQIFQQFDALPAAQQTAEQLVALVNSALEFDITLDHAVDILARMRNRQFVAGHPYLGTETVPRIRDFSEFFIFGEFSRMNLLGRAVASQQNVVWGTGTHTSTPVVLVAKGPAAHRFGGMHHSTEIGQRLMELLRDE